MAHIEFQINYQTKWGEQLYITGNVPELGNNDIQKAVPMHFKSNGNWNLVHEIDTNTSEIEYSYLVKENSHIVTQEWGNPRKIVSVESQQKILLIDQWQGLPANKPFFSSAFTDCLFARPNTKLSKDKKWKMSITFKVFAPTVPSHLSVGIVGSIAELGNWDISKTVMLEGTQFPEWSISINAAKIPANFEFKFVLIENTSNKTIAWEWGENRSIFIDKVSDNQNIVVSGLHFKNPLPNWKAAGVAIPVFSLRSEQSFGIGDFSDLLKMTDWAVSTGQRVIQILPINDTTMNHTWQDSYPYNANSIFALHPVYLNPMKIGILKDKKRDFHYTTISKNLNALPEIDYEAVTVAKWSYYKEIFAQEGEKTLKSKDFISFFELNQEWLIPYAAFCFLRDKYHTPDFRLWKTNSDFNSSAIQKLTSQESENWQEISIHYFLQYHLHLQMREAVDYAHSKQVILKGDIPIGISRTSVEAWTEPHYFNMNGQAGAPPDDFSVNGQNWGFPTYNWDVMAQDGYNWWIKRFRKMADYFDAYRIDHVLGFFRIWEVPSDAVHGLLGHFSPAMPMSIDEIHGYGIGFNHQRMTKPFIQKHIVYQVFGEYGTEIINTFLHQTNAFDYELKEEFNTQQKVQQCFEGKIDEKSILIRDGLYSLISEVLFVADPQEPNKFHPRISAQHTFSFQSLNDYEKACYNRLYDDFYYKRHNDFWYHQSMQKLPALISATSMLVCAEDLGMIPKCVPAVMDQLQILSLEIQRMPKDERVEFGYTDGYPYLSVSTTSTHDMSTIRGWWEEDRTKTDRYFHHILGKQGDTPYFCEPEISENIVRNHLWSPSMLVILPLQDWLAMDETIRRTDPNDERINIPSNPRHYWRYRMHISLEELIESQNLNTKISEMINQSGR